MKLRSVTFALLLLGVGSLLPGCPIYGNGDAGCLEDAQCSRGYACDLRSGRCVRESTCERPGDCGENQTCGRSGRCVVGDCTFSTTGCVAGYRCAKPRGSWECIPEDEIENPGAGGAGTAGAPASQGGEGGMAEGGNGGGASDVGTAGTTVE